MFDSKQKREHEIIDLSAVPPCRQVLSYHIQRSNYIAYLWRQSDTAIIDQSFIENHGWMQNGDIYWMDAAYPHVFEEMLYINENEDGIDHDSDSVLITKVTFMVVTWTVKKKQMIEIVEIVTLFHVNYMI